MKYKTPALLIELNAPVTMVTGHIFKMVDKGKIFFQQKGNVWIPVKNNIINVTHRTALNNFR